MEEIKEKTWELLDSIEGSYHIWEEDNKKEGNNFWVKISHSKRKPTKKELEAWKHPNSEKGAYRFQSRKGAEGFIKTIIKNKKQKTLKDEGK